ncbi:MAG: 4Fe-4S binding protein [Treponema sp.]|jgi:dissimilatory sulfite reductase (desulfoviridin) alpha/beta subunit|nr:4Fe-4S binding protein [Treponema sp.]
MAEVDYGTLKKGGFMRQVQKDRFSLRLRVIGGHLTADKIAKIREIAEKYGHGYIHLTSRQGVEIPFVPLEHIETIKTELATVGLQPGACGPRVRTVTACQGAAICPSGLIETSGIAQELDARYFGRELPHKFKIGITGCKNNCLKAEENDLGIKGGLFPTWQSGACTYCGLCAAVCPAGVITVDQDTPTLSFDEQGCVSCGKCVKSCPADAWQGKRGYLLSFGGMFGNEIKPGLRLLPILFEKDQVFKAADATLAFFAAQARPGERLGKTLTRVGPETLQKQLEEAVG